MKPFVTWSARLLAAATTTLFCVSVCRAQEKPAPAPKKIAIRAGRLIDGKSNTAIANALIVVEGDKIVSVTPGGTPPAGVEVIDLSKATVLPGFVDAHTHVLLQGDITAEDYDAQLLKQSIPYRAILAARNAQIALGHGFTAMRDLETEGAMYADVDVKKAINNGEVPGPHMQVSTRAMTPTGMYPLLGYSWELKVPTGVQYVDGVEEIRKAVREQIMYGADWIKYYSDHGYFYGPDGVVLHSHVNFTDEEAKAIVEETHRLGRKVAAHAIGSDGIAAALKAGVGAQRQLAEDGGDREGRVPAGAQEGREDCAGHRRRRLRLAWAEPGAGVRLLREIRHDADAGDSQRDDHRGGNAGLVGQNRYGGSREVGRPGGGVRRPAEGHHGVAARKVCDEGRQRLQERTALKIGAG